MGFFAFLTRKASDRSLNAQAPRNTPPSRQSTTSSFHLLDARGEFRPSDFRARLAASGTRDFGEDVADRNIGENGLILSSKPVQTFYASRTVPQHTSAQKVAVRSLTPIEVIHEGAEDDVSASRSSHLARAPSRSASVRTNLSVRLNPSCRPASKDSSQSIDLRSRSAASSLKHRASMISIGRPVLEHSVQALSVAEESDDSACPPTVPRYRQGDPEADCRQHTPATLSSQNAPTASLARHRAPLPIDNINYWTAPQTRLPTDSTANQPSMPHHLSPNLSRRNWSIASTAPTTEGSETSSVWNIRSQSRCTATTSVDLESLPETEDETTEKEVAVHGEGAPPTIHGTYDSDLSYTTDGSDIDVFIKKRIYRAIPDDEALLFNEVGFQNGGGTLPGLFDELGKLVPSIPTPVVEESGELEEIDDGGETPQSIQTPDSTSGMFVPGMYLTQRQRMLALGFDYDTDDEELEEMESDTGEEIGRVQKSSTPRVAQPLPSFRQVRSEEDRQSDDTKARMALTLRREIKKHKRSSVKPRKVPKRAVEVDGNLADVE
ncbi:hypothetical protein K4F52_004868 [Lecanicillium sp. MT-2017a]|nr:hypothetical protein K4F52_004868 [Lecanicillium sp. MT-2017a]